MGRPVEPVLGEHGRLKVEDLAGVGVEVLDVLGDGFEEALDLGLLGPLGEAVELAQPAVLEGEEDRQRYEDRHEADPQGVPLSQCRDLHGRAEV